MNAGKQQATLIVHQRPGTMTVYYTDKQGNLRRLVLPGKQVRPLA